jgi:hypothetical protein
MVTATPHEDVEAAYGQGREEQLVLDIMCDAALCCRERHPYMPTNEEERRNFVPHLWVLEGASEYANHAYAEGRKDEAEQGEKMRRALGDIICQTVVNERMDYSDRQVWAEKSARIRQIARGGLDSIPDSSTVWRPIETAPEDENVLVATTGGWVDTAFWTDDGDGPKWWWLLSASAYARHPLHPDLVPTHWMPLPKHPEEA